MLFVQDNQEESDQGQDVSTSSKTQHSQADVEEKAWLLWIRKYKAPIEVISLIVGFIVAIWTIWSLQAEVGQLAEQTKATSKQTEAINKQTTEMAGAMNDQIDAIIENNKSILKQTAAINNQTTKIANSMEAQVNAILEQTRAMWYERKPLLRFESVKLPNDIKPYVDPGDSLKKLFNYIDGLKIDSASLYTFYFTIKNIGKSHGTIKTISGKLLIEDHELEFRGIEKYMDLYVDGGLSLDFPLPLSKEHDNMIHIMVEYIWNDNPKTEPFFISRYYLIRFEGGGWSAHMEPADQYQLLRPKHTIEQTIEF